MFILMLHTFHKINWHIVFFPFLAVPDQTERQPRGQTIRARPVCSACKNPMRGHKFVTDCPRNRRTYLSKVLDFEGLRQFSTHLIEINDLPSVVFKPGHDTGNMF